MPAPYGKGKRGKPTAGNEPKKARIGKAPKPRRTKKVESIKPQKRKPRGARQKKS